MLVLLANILVLIVLGIVCVAVEDNAKDAAGEWLRIAVRAGLFFCCTFAFLMSLTLIGVINS